MVDRRSALVWNVRFGARLIAHRIRNSQHASDLVCLAGPAGRDPSVKSEASRATPALEGQSYEPDAIFFQWFAASPTRTPHANVAAAASHRAVVDEFSL
jgi:hypothetical protein